MTEKRSVSISIGLKADLFAGEGCLTDVNREKIDDLIAQDGLMASEIISDWIRLLQWHQMRAQASRHGDEWRRAIERGEKTAPTIDDLVLIYELVGAKQNDCAIGDAFQDAAGTDADLSYDLFKRWMVEQDRGKVIAFSPACPSAPA